MSSDNTTPNAETLRAELDIEGRAISYLQADRRGDDMGAEVAQVMLSSLKSAAEHSSFIAALAGMVRGGFTAGFDLARNAVSDDSEAEYERWLRWAADQVEQAADQLNADDEN